METNKNEKEITLGYMLGILKKSVIWMIIAAVILGVAAALYTALLVKPTYRATTGFYVINTSNNDYILSTQTQAATTLAASYAELANHDVPVRSAVRKHDLMAKLGYTNENDCVAAIRRSIKASMNDEMTLVFYVNIETASRNATYEIANAFQQEFPEVLVELTGVANEEVALVKAVSMVYSVDDVIENKSSPVKAFILAAIAGAVLIYAIFFVMTLLNTTIYDEKTIKENFDQPIIGTIPTWESEEGVSKKRRRISAKKRKERNVLDRDYKGKLLCETSPFAISEAFNALRTNVVYSSNAAKNPIFAVTSPFAGAGKSVISANLALSLSSIDKKVLLVECDMRCPAFSSLLGKKAKNGLSELIAGIVDKTSDVVETSLDGKIDVIFGGKIPPNASDLLASERMRELVDEWKTKYDIIILDMPPICEVVDAGVVSDIVNGYILAVRCEMSDVKELRDAISSIESVDGNIVGFVLNDANPKSGAKYSHYKNSRYYSRYAIKPEAETKD